MDQTTLLFVLEDNKMYDVKDVVYFSQYGLDKRQCTVRVTVFAGGSAKIPSLIIFKGKYFADKWRRKKRWNKRVAVVFQMNVWCNKRPWRFGCPPTNGSCGKILFADIYPQSPTLKLCENNVKKSKKLHLLTYLVEQQAV